MPDPQLSAQDRADLTEIRKQLPQDDPRRAKLDTLLGPDYATNPLPGTKVAGRNSAGQPIFAPEGDSALHEGVTAVLDPHNWSEVASGAWNEVKGVGKGIASLFAPPQTDLEKKLAVNPAALLAYRMGKGEVQSRGQLTQQSADFFKKHEPVRGAVSETLAAVPVPGVAAMGAGVNEAESEGNGAKAVGQGLADTGMLLSGEGVKGVAKVVPPAFRAGMEKITGTSPTETAKAVEATKAENAETANKVTKLNAKRSEMDTTRADKVKAGNAEALKAHDAEVAEANRRNTEAHVKHLAEKTDVEHTNQAAEAIPDSRAGLETYIQAQTEAADIATEKARHDALQIGNEKYSAVNEKLNPLPADQETIQNAVVDASGKIKGSETEPAILKDISRKIEQGEALNYEDLQGYYSELGTALSKGNLPGDVYAAMDTLHDAIGDDMQRIADSQGQGAQLKDARNYWRRMKQTFGKSSDSIPDRAGKAIQTANPDFTESQTNEFRNRLLGSFDPEIPKLLQNAAAARERLAKLPSEEQARAMRKPVPKPPDEVVPEPPKTKPVPKPRPPLKAPVRNVGTEDIRNAKTAGLQERALWIQKAGFRAARYAIGMRALVDVWHHGVNITADVGAGVGAYGATQFLAGMLKNPKVVRLLTEPTARDLAEIPPEMRGDVSQIAQAAKKQGINVAPALLAGVAGSGAAQVQHPAFSQQSPVQ
jgi:hypothetical protein